jgi:hypothetical protein
VVDRDGQGSQGRAGVDDHALTEEDAMTSPFLGEAKAVARDDLAFEVEGPFALSEDEPPRTRPAEPLTIGVSVTVSAGGTTTTCTQDGEISVACGQRVDSLVGAATATYKDAASEDVTSKIAWTWDSAVRGTGATPDVSTFTTTLALAHIVAKVEIGNVRRSVNVTVKRACGLADLGPIGEDQKVLARVVYAEGDTTNAEERAAIAWTVLNRMALVKGGDADAMKAFGSEATLASVVTHKTADGKVQYQSYWSYRDAKGVPNPTKPQLDAIKKWESIDRLAELTCAECEALHACVRTAGGALAGTIPDPYAPQGTYYMHKRVDGVIKREREYSIVRLPKRADFVHYFWTYDPPVKKEVADETEAPAAEPKLGVLSERYESRGDAAAVSSGAGDAGGASYGLYQLTSKNRDGSAGGRVAEYVAQSRYGAVFSGKTPGTPEFTAAWRAVAAREPAAFGDEQWAFIKATHYDPLASRLRTTLALDIDLRSNALRQVVWSTAVQHGPTSVIIDKALAGRAPDSLDDAALIAAIFAERGRRDQGTGEVVWFKRNSRAVQDQQPRRFADEQARALDMLAKEPRATHELYAPFAEDRLEPEVETAESEGQLYDGPAPSPLADSWRAEAEEPGPTLEQLAPGPIGAVVGCGQTNQHDDVVRVQARLRALGMTWVPETGLIGTAADDPTDRAIRLFKGIVDGARQLESRVPGNNPCGATATGLINPGGRHEQWLRSSTAPRWLMQIPARRVGWCCNNGKGPACSPDDGSHGIASWLVEYLDEVGAAFRAKLDQLRNVLNVYISGHREALDRLAHPTLPHVGPYGPWEEDAARGAALAQRVIADLVERVTKFKMDPEEIAKKMRAALGGPTSNARAELGVSLSVGNIARPQGGPFPPHHEHQTGLEFDLRLFGHEGPQQGLTFCDASCSRLLDGLAVDCFLEHRFTRTVIHNDPVIYGRSNGRVQHDKKPDADKCDPNLYVHDNHVHVAIQGAEGRTMGPPVIQ